MIYKEIYSGNSGAVGLQKNLFGEKSQGKTFIYSFKINLNELLWNYEEEGIHSIFLYPYL